MLYLIGILKILKGFLLLALAVAAFKLIGKNLTDVLQRLSEQFFFDPKNHYFQKAVQKVSGLDEKNLPWLSIGTFIYSAMFFTEGVGLLLQKTWAEWLTIIITSSFLPFEIYEIVKGFSAVKIVVLIANLAIVIYLAWRLHREKQNSKARPA